MLTQDKEITTPDYWDRVYNGANNNAKVDASNTVRPPNPFNRFEWVAKYAEGPHVLGVGSGHAHVEKAIKNANPEWKVYASDQCEGAKKAARYQPYFIVSAYDIGKVWDDKTFNTVIITQALEYIEHQEKFFREAKRVGDKLLMSVPIGEMAKWSQLRIYTEQNVRQLLEPFGVIENFERHEDLLLVKLCFHD